MRAVRLLTPVALLALASSPLIADWATERREFNEAYRSTDPAGRAEAVKKLQDADHAEGARFLVERFIFEKDETVLAALGDKLCDLGSPEAREALKKEVLGETDPKRRAKLVRIFVDGRGLDRVEIFKRLLADRDPVVREAVAAALGERDALLTRFVAALATDPMPDVRKAAVGALGRIATIECVEPLITCLENESVPAIRDTSIASLHRITDRNYGANPEAWRDWWRKHKVGDLDGVDKAIYMGADYLRKNLKTIFAQKVDPKKPMAMFAFREVPVMTYALIHSGVDASDPGFKAGIEYIASKPPDGTYNAALMALALADLDADRYGARLAELAQLLCDQQCTNGQWSYGMGDNRTVTPAGQDLPPPDEESGPGGGTKKGPKRKYPIAWRDGKRPHIGDNSNTQFAVLGLRAAMDGGAELPKAMWERTLDWYYKCQAPPYGGWGYGMGALGVESWAMTCSGTVSITICLHALGKDEAFRNGKPLEVVRVKNGADWLNEHWLLKDTATKPPMGMGFGFYYDVYSLERVGMIVGLEKVGDHDWYEEGKARLLEWQDDDGSWGGNVIDTAFAILFLKRATKGYEISPQDEK